MMQINCLLTTKNEIVAQPVTSCQTVLAMLANKDFNSKEEIQKMLDYAGTNLTWPDEKSLIDDVFVLYNRMEQTKTYMMVVSTLLFWTSLVLDVWSFFTRQSLASKASLLTWSRITNFAGSLCVFARYAQWKLMDFFFCLCVYYKGKTTNIIFQQMTYILWQMA